MTVQAGGISGARRALLRIVPLVVLAAAGVAVRTDLAAAHPLAALLLFLWVVSDTPMLALIARSSGRPGRQAVLGTLAGATLAVALGSPPAIRAVLLESPALAVAMAAVMLAHVAWGAARAGRMLLGSDGSARVRLFGAASEILPPALVRLAAAELAILHTALFRWGGPADVPADARAFPYHRHLTPMCATLLVLSAIEIAVYHLLVGYWSRTAAIAMFVVSDLGFVYLVGLIKSFRFRPILLTPEGVRVRGGFLIDHMIPVESIVAVKTGFTGDEVRDPATLNAALLAWPNVLLRLDRPVHRRSLLKRRRSCDSIAFRLDDPEPFVRLLRWRLGHRG